MKRLMLFMAAGAMLFAACAPEQNKPEEKPKVVEANSLTLNYETVDVALGETVTLTATVLPEDATNKAVVWNTGDPSIATVKDGVVTGVAVGETTILATVGELTARCKVSVVIPLKSLALSPDKIEMLLGETRTITPVFTPKDATVKKVEWSFADRNVISIDDNGVVTGIGFGTTTVTATANGLEATAEVTVSYIRVESISFAPENPTITVGYGQAIRAHLTPSDAYNNIVTWKSSNPNIVTVTEGTIVGNGVSLTEAHGVSIGKAWVIASADGVKDSTLVTVVPEAVEPKIIFKEDFEDTLTFDNWTKLDKDGDGYVWIHKQKYSIEGDYTIFKNKSGNGSALSASYINKNLLHNDLVLTPDNWLVSPPIELDSHVNYLSFWVAPQDMMYWEEHFAVYISSAEIGQGEVLLTEVTLTQSSSSLVRTDDNKFEYHVVLIPQQFNGHTVQLSFRHFNCTDIFWLVLDDVYVSTDDPTDWPDPASAPDPAPAKSIRKK